VRQTAVATVISGPGRTTGGSFGARRPGLPQVEFVFGQPPLDERRLKHPDYLLVVGVRRAELATALASRGCYLISRPCHHGTSPPAWCREA
jgi:hypothetical protein